MIIISSSIRNNHIKDRDQIMILDNEPIILLHFISTDQSINNDIDIACEAFDGFSVVEDRLYQEFPDFKKKNICFLMDGSVIDRNANLEDNRIKDGCIIIINEFDED